MLFAVSFLSCSNPMCMSFELGKVWCQRSTIGLKPIAPETVGKYTEDITIDGGLIQKALGFVPQYDLKRGWEEAIRERNGYKF